MKIVFFGTSEFAITPLQALLNSKHRVIAVVTQPDRKKGRSLKLSPPPVKVLALSHNIPVYQPQDASADQIADYLKPLGADLFVVISFGQILKKNILAIPKIYSINIHGSLLPKYRGAAPTNWAVINGDKVSGVTVMKMNEKMDEGDIILKKEVVIDADDTNITLSEKLSDAGSAAMLETIELIESGKKIDLVKQDGAQATYAPKMKKEDGLVDWNLKASDIHNRVRGLLPWPGAYTHYEGKILKILQTEVFAAGSSGAKPGEVVDIIKTKGISVCTGSGSIIIKFLQLEGKRDMDADAFVRGHKIDKGYIFK